MSGNSVAHVAAELGAVAQPVVADLVLAERAADRVDVAGRVVRADELDDSSLRSTHALGEVLGQVDDLLALGVVVGGDVGAGVVVVVVVDAIDGRLALAGAAGVPADDVEAVEEVLAVDQLGGRGEDRPAEPGPARVDEQRADALDGSLARCRTRYRLNSGRRGWRSRSGPRGTLLEPVAERRPLDRLGVERRQRVDGASVVSAPRSVSTARQLVVVSDVSLSPSLAGLDDLGGLRRLGRVRTRVPAAPAPADTARPASRSAARPRARGGRIMGGILEAPCDGRPSPARWPRRRP